MNDFCVRERRFEDDIEAALLRRGYEQGVPSRFDRKLALDTQTFLDFIRTSQPQAWKKLETNYGANVETKVIERFCRVVKQQGLLHVLRQGFVDRGVTIRPVFWKPETSINATAQEQYARNVLHCTRQLHYSLSSENSIDIVLFVNGIPVVSMELKCQFTGQSVGNAISQYKFDRAGKDAIFAFKERVLVHFAVDLSQVAMTTRLEGAKTYFLPFNQGSNGAGGVGGQGNPANKDGYDTAYLWEEVLCKDRLLEILQKYLHLQVEKDEKGNVVKETMIFPRYHQLDVVSKLLTDVREHGAGQNYLIQHSAGSGKSNSIAWLAHRLSGLHDARDEKIFHSVIIVTDRRVLDSQLQDTVYQFDHQAGVVVKVDENAKQLRDAINDKASVIITTLQKFPVIYKEVESGRRRFAIIVDEAHSSQTGEAARKLKHALADTEKILEEHAREEEAAERAQGDAEDRLMQELAAQGNQHKNMSFFAFTATPKDKTLNMFGRRGEDGRYHPFHIYSMRQAIEEGFILDVLRNYMTYGMYYKIAKMIEQDPVMDTAAAARAITRFETLHPHNIAQKTAVMLEHFRSRTRHCIGGKAKAMVVTPSRLHAVRYIKEFKRQIRAKGWTDVDVLVAFSGEVDDDGIAYTEESVNKQPNGEVIREKALPKAFHTDDFNILIVAEKYQTGFDEPLLHTMFVDKRLTGVKAVQTLSRLNRTARGKTDTFVLDFVNSADDIKSSFEPYYEETVLSEETDPNVLHDLKSTLDDMRIYRGEEVMQFASLFFSAAEQSEGDLGRLESKFRPALDRYAALEDEKQDLFKSTLARFNRVYAFVTQVYRDFDAPLHKFSVYARFLAKLLPKKPGVSVEIDDKVLLEYYTLKKEFEGDIKLEASKDGMKPITGDAGRRETKKDPLTVIIENINERFGTEFTEMDKVLQQLQNDMAKEKKWSDWARSTDEPTFRSLFEKEFRRIAALRYTQNDLFFKKLFTEHEMMDIVTALMSQALYDRLRNQTQVYPIQEEEVLEAAENTADE